MSDNHAHDLRELQEELVPSASWFRVYYCHDRTHAHIVLFGNDDRPFAQFTINQVNLDSINAATAEVLEAGPPEPPVPH